jgi:Flp pilus assembly protein CpaB
MKSKSFMLMILSMGFGLIAAIGISQVMGRTGGPTTTGPQLAPVLVASQHLDHNSILDETNVVVENWPVEIIPETAATSIEQIKDMATRAQLSKGLPIMIPHIVHKNDLQDLHIPEGMKVFAIKVAEDDTIAGLLNPGDKVDVIGRFRVKDGSGFYAKTFLKALRIFSVNSEMTAQAGNRTETSTRGSAIVGVLVTPRQAEAIYQVQVTGALKLILRGDHFMAGDDVEVAEVSEMLDRGENDLQPSKAVASTPKKSSFTPHGFGNLAPKQARPESMIVWNGFEPVKTVFQAGTLPDSSYRRSNRLDHEMQAEKEAAMLSQAEREASEESGDISESERGFEEDQYRGE